MKELKEGLIYATVNGITGFSVYTGAALFYGDNLQPAVIAGAGIGLLAFGSYLIRETDGIEFDPAEALPANERSKSVKTVQRIAARFTPSCVRRHGLFHILF